MIDLKALRDDPARFKTGAALKNVDVDIDRLVELDARKRELGTKVETLRAEQNKLAKETGPKIGQLMGKLKSAGGDEKAALEAEVESIKAAPARLKQEIQEIEAQVASIDPEMQALLLAVPLPPDDDVPRGKTSDDNVEIRRWAPEGWDYAKTFEENRGFAPRTHQELCESLGLVDFPRRQARGHAELHPHRRRHAPAPGDPAVRGRRDGQRERVRADERAGVGSRGGDGRHRVLPRRSRPVVPRRGDQPGRRAGPVPDRHRRGRADGRARGRDSGRVDAAAQIRDGVDVLPA
ncbi:MAG: hypothetical protein R3B49_08230 [Phycisphaerales bacterium]